MPRHARRRASPAGCCTAPSPARRAPPSSATSTRSSPASSRRGSARDAPGAGTGARRCCRLPPASAVPMPRSARRASKEPRMSLTQRFDELRDDVGGALRQMRRAPGVHGAGGGDAGARHRRQQRHLRAGRRDAAAAAAGARARSPRADLGAHRHLGAQAGSSPLEPARLARPQPHLRAAWPASLPRVGAMVMAGADGAAENVSRQWVTAGFFDVFGVRPLVGRTFTRRRQRDGAPEAVVLSEAFWRTRFGADPPIVGRIAPARRRPLHRRRRRAAHVAELHRSRRASGRALQIDPQRARRAARTSCRRSAG